MTVHASDIDIEGVDNDDVLDNIQVMVDSVTKPQKHAEIQAYQELVLEKAKIAAQVFGYYHLQATVIAPKDDELEDDWLMQVNLGEVTTLSNVSIVVNGDAEQDSAMQKLLA